MNGWQRLWFAVTAIAIVVFGLIYPVVNMNSRRDFTFRLSVEKDYNNPACAKFLSEPFELLQEPAFGDDGNCYHIYTSRQYANNRESFPTYEDWVSDNNAAFWSSVFGLCFASTVMILLISAVVYGLGRIVGWIVNGFRKSA
jgi:hypothetical protein